MVADPVWTTHVDYVAFSVPIPRAMKDDEAWIHANLPDELSGLIRPELTTYLLSGTGWEEGAKRRPYRKGYANRERGFYVFYGGHSNVLIEATGGGCTTLRDSGALWPLLQDTGKRLTRVDVACDVVTTVTPREFVDAGYSERIRSFSHMASSSGQTSYIGSRKSDRFAAVYRYAPPHIRADQLRVEFRTRSTAARATADRLLDTDTATVAAELGASMDLQHPLWNLSKEETLTVPRETRGNARTERWLIKQAAPAFRRLVEQGDIEDPVAWLNRWFLDEIGKHE